jgi:hypothetical protein
MKRNLLLLLCGIAALQYSAVSATVGDIIDSAVNTAGDIANAAVAPTHHTDVVQVVNEPVTTGEPALISETVTTEPAIVDGEPAVLKTTVIEETTPVEEGANVAGPTVEYVEHEGWFSRVWRSIFG